MYDTDQSLFVVNALSWGVVVRSGDIGGIVENHCLNYLVLIQADGILDAPKVSFIDDGIINKLIYLSYFAWWKCMT